MIVGNNVTMSSVLLSLGSNIGDRLLNIERARKAVGYLGREIAMSSLYETTAVGGSADKEFINGALCCETDMQPEEFMLRLLAVEADLGRQRRKKWENRLIDLDILLWRDANESVRVVNLPYLQIPHPQMLIRDFVLLPASEIAPSWRHPISKDFLSLAVKLISHDNILRKIYL